MKNTEKDAGKEREFMRIEATLPMKISPVSPEEIPHLKSRVANDSAFSFKHPHSFSNQSLDEWLNYLDSKLDLILQLLSENQKILDTPLQVCNISAGGMRIVSPDKFSQGDILEVKMVYPSSTPQILRLYGEVLRSETKDKGYITALKFVFMDDAVRDKIVKLVFEKEREMIREKKGK